MSKVEGLGTDIIEIERIRAALNRHEERFLNTLFTEKEQLYCKKFSDPVPHYAGRFAAKEAVLKALGMGLTGQTSWLDIEIVSDQFGKPLVIFSEKMRKHYPEADFLLSISHCKEYATATALLLRKQ